MNIFLLRPTSRQVHRAAVVLMFSLPVSGCEVLFDGAPTVGAASEFDAGRSEREDGDDNGGGDEGGGGGHH